jgi:hypothetical protein
MFYCYMNAYHTANFIFIVQYHNEYLIYLNMCRNGFSLPVFLTECLIISM